MTFLIRRTIRALVAPEHALSCSTSCWMQGISELKRRGEGRRESGAFLLGTLSNTRRHIQRFVYFDDLLPNALDAGHIVFERRGYSKLWKLCRELRMQVVADVHTHPKQAFLSSVDCVNPMIPQAGHIAIVLPHFAQDSFDYHSRTNYGIYRYQGCNTWSDHSGADALKFFYIGRW